MGIDANKQIFWSPLYVSQMVAQLRSFFCTNNRENQKNYPSCMVLRPKSKTWKCFVKMYCLANTSDQSSSLVNESRKHQIHITFSMRTNITRCSMVESHNKDSQYRCKRFTISTPTHSPTPTHTHDCKLAIHWFRVTRWLQSIDWSQMQTQECVCICTAQCTPI